MQTPMAPGAAALPLGLPDGMQDALANAVQGPVGSAQVGQLAGNGVLDVLVLAASSLEDQLDLDLLLVLPLLEMDDGGAGAQVVAAVLARQRVHRVGAELAPPGGLGNSLEEVLPQRQLVGAHRGPDLEGGHPGVLADGALVLGSHVDVGGDDVEGLGSLGGGRLGLQAVGHGPPHVRRKVGGGLGDEFQNTILK